MPRPGVQLLRAGVVGLLVSELAALPAHAQAGPTPVPPAPGFTRYHILRGEENFGFLRQDSLRTDLFDPLKYIPLGRRPGYFLTLGADIRYQYEVITHDYWGRGQLADTPPTNAYLLQRHMVHTDWRLGSHLRLFGQLLSTNELGRRGGPRPYIDRDIFDVYQAFVEVAAPLGQAQATLRVGRQEFLYGSERLLSMREGPNTRQSFDAARLQLTRPGWRLDMLVGRPLLTNPNALDDRGDPQQLLWGAYGARTLARLHGGLDFYYFGLNRHNAFYLQGIGHEQRQTGGVRWWASPAPFGYDIEAIGQFGRFNSGTIRAYYVSAALFCQLANWPLTPTLRFTTNAISGDQDPRNPDLQAFNALFPRPFFGAANTPIGPGNLLDAHPGVELHLTPRMKVVVDVDWLWRQSLGDGLYGPNIIPVVPQDGPGAPLPTSRYIGQQFSADWNWQASRHFALDFTYSLLPAGAYLQATTPGLTLSYYKPTLLFQF
ncbi:MAG: alginate export family protein [Janthinobacterium lividum]